MGNIEQAAWFRSFEGWAKGRSTKKYLENHVNTTIGNELKNKILNSVEGWTGKNSAEKLKGYYDGNILPTWAKKMVTFVKENKQFGIDVDKLQKDAKARLRKGYKQLNDIQTEKEEEEDDEIKQYEHKYEKLLNAAKGHEDSDNFEGQELLNRFPGVDLLPEEIRTIQNLKGRELREYLASQHNSYTNLRNDKNGRLVSSEVKGISKGQEQVSLLAGFEYSSKMTKKIQDGTWDKREGKSLLEEVDADASLTPIVKAAIKEKIEKAIHNKYLYTRKKEIFSRLMKITNKLTKAGKFDSEYIMATGFRKQLWKEVKSFYSDLDSSPTDMIIGLKNFVSKNHNLTANYLMAAVDEYEEIQVGPGGVGTTNSINDFFKKDWSKDPVGRRREIRHLKKEILQEKLNLVKHEKRGIFSKAKVGLNIEGPDIPNATGQRKALEKIEEMLKLYDDVSKVTVGFEGITEEGLKRKDIGYMGEILTEAIHPSIEVDSEKKLKNPQDKNEGLATE